jgi:transposase
LVEGEERLWMWLRVREIEPTNRAAERALRHAMLWRKMCGGTASEWRRQFIERVLRVVAPFGLLGENILEFLTRCIPAHVAGSPRS